MCQVANIADDIDLVEVGDLRTLLSKKLARLGCVVVADLLVPVSNVQGLGDHCARFGVRLAITGKHEVSRGRTHDVLDGFAPCNLEVLLVLHDIGCKLVLSYELRLRLRGRLREVIQLVLAEVLKRLFHC